MQSGDKKAPPWRGKRADLSPEVINRWSAMRDKIEDHDYTRPAGEESRGDQDTGLGGAQKGSGNGRRAFSVRQSEGQRADRNGSDNRLSWYQIASDLLSMDRAVRSTCDQAPRRSVDDNYDIYRPVDFHGM